MVGEPLAGNAAQAQDKARRLIEVQPWLHDPEWEAGRIVHNPEPHGGALTANLRTGICVVLAIPWLVIAYDHESWPPLVVTAFFLLLAAASMRSRLKAHHGRSECLLRSLPARIGGALEADVTVRLRAKADAPAMASLVALSTIERRVREIWRAEQQIRRDEIRFAQGAWTIPVRIPIPATLRALRGLHPACHIDEFNPLWQLEMRVETAGPDYTAHFHVPVYDLADLPYAPEKGRREHRPAAGLPRLPDLLSPETGVGLLVGTILGFAVGFLYGGEVRYAAHKGLFLLPFFGALFTFSALGVWRRALGVALRDRDLPDRGREMRLRAWLLTLAPWALAAVVLWVAWLLLPFGGLVWGVGMLLCARTQPFGGFWRDPVFQSGAALVVCSLLIR